MQPSGDSLIVAKSMVHSNLCVLQISCCDFDVIIESRVEIPSDIFPSWSCPICFWEVPLVTSLLLSDWHTIGSSKNISIFAKVWNKIVSWVSWIQASFWVVVLSATSWWADWVTLDFDELINRNIIDIHRTYLSKHQTGSNLFQHY